MKTLGLMPLFAHKIAVLPLWLLVSGVLQSDTNDSQTLEGYR